jgi:hypothetical protein
MHLDHSKLTRRDEASQRVDALLDSQAGVEHEGPNKAIGVFLDRRYDVLVLLLEGAIEQDRHADPRHHRCAVDDPLSAHHVDGLVHQGDHVFTHERETPWVILSATPDGVSLAEVNMAVDDHFWATCCAIKNSSSG